jgi:hypothetical protein
MMQFCIKQEKMLVHKYERAQTLLFTNRIKYNLDGLTIFNLIITFFLYSNILLFKDVPMWYIMIIIEYFGSGGKFVTE